MKAQRPQPGPGQESVWAYPRPPLVERSGRRVRVEFNGEVVADTERALRVLETSHPPVYYIPRDDVRTEYLSPSPRETFCEFKGCAAYVSLQVVERTSRDAAWYYPDPAPGYEAIRDHLAFYPSRVDACFVDGERVLAQEGGFYGGWITSEIAGPFKGGAGTTGW
jgi:uncharacterized protein (DUF427 family)